MKSTQYLSSTYRIFIVTAAPGIFSKIDQKRVEEDIMREMGNQRKDGVPVVRSGKGKEGNHKKVSGGTEREHQRTPMNEVFTCKRHYFVC